jgi:hypothetical protein
MSTQDRPPQGTPPDRRSAAWSTGRVGKERRSGTKGRVAKARGLTRFLIHPVGKVFLGLLVLGVLAGAGAFIHYYSKYAKLIDERLKGGPYTATSRIYAAPNSVAVGDTSTPG